MSFNSIIGNDKIKEILNRTIQLNKVTHSYLFVGPSGIGKTLFAKEFAKQILCLEEIKSCQNCKSCVSFDSSNHPDFKMISPEEGSIKIEQIRNMQEKVLEKPIISNYKVYVIKDADTMTREAQNCLLKTLEEPPSFVVIILIAANESNLLTTIKSRCTKVIFEQIEDTILQEYLITKGDFVKEDMKNMQAFGGSIEKAESILKKKELYTKIENIFTNREKTTLIDAFGALQEVYKAKEDIFEILDYINTIFVQKSIHDITYVSYIKKVEEIKRNLKANSNYDMSIDSLLYQIWEE